jgi:hypothetical protein
MLVFQSFSNEKNKFTSEIIEINAEKCGGTYFLYIHDWILHNERYSEEKLFDYRNDAFLYAAECYKKYQDELID